MGRGQRKTVGGIFQAITFRLDAKTCSGVGRGFRSRTSPQPFQHPTGQDGPSRLPPRTSCPREAGIVEAEEVGNAALDGGRAPVALPQTCRPQGGGPFFTCLSTYPLRL